MRLIYPAGAARSLIAVIPLRDAATGCVQRTDRRAPRNGKGPMHVCTGPSFLARSAAR